MAYIHFWVTIVGAYLIFWPMHYEGLAGMPRRYFDYQRLGIHLTSLVDLNRFISNRCDDCICCAADCLYSTSSIPFSKEEKLPRTNPWGANTLEWTTPIQSWSW